MYPMIEELKSDKVKEISESSSGLCEKIVAGEKVIPDTFEAAIRTGDAEKWNQACKVEHVERCIIGQKWTTR